MKKCILFFVAVLFLIGGQVSAQNQADSIQVQKRLGTIFVQNGRPLTPRQLLEVTKTNTDAYSEMKIAKSNYDIGSVFGFIGGFCIGWPLGTAIGGGDPNWTIAGVGVALVVVSIPLSTAYTTHAKKAVGIYNSGLNQVGTIPVTYRFGFTGSGIGLRVRF